VGKVRVSENARGFAATMAPIISRLHHDPSNESLKLPLAVAILNAPIKHPTQSSLDPMSHQHPHSDHDRGHSEPSRKRPIHHSWLFWTAVLVMLAAMVVYVMTKNESIGPGSNGQPVPAANG
jgi:hypothetical protein